MNIIYTKEYEKKYKELKKHPKEKELLEKIIICLKNMDSFSLVIKDPVSKIYNLERLKHNLNEYYSFRLSSIFRLIIRPLDNDIEVELVYISTKQYNDFKKKVK